SQQFAGDLDILTPIDKTIRELEGAITGISLPAQQALGHVALVDDVPGNGVDHPYRQRMISDQESEEILTPLSFGDIQDPDDQRGARSVDA
ncbi:hypothetical protein AB4144_63880, partial [Rhizobiaceae sp. 2RAB30]